MTQLEHTDTALRLDQLTGLSIELSRNPDTPLLLERILLAAKGITHADGGTLYRLSGDRQALDFHIAINDTLGMHQGGASGHAVDILGIPLFDRHGGPNLESAASYAASFGLSINIEDVYQTSLFNFSGMLWFDAQYNYRSQSLLTVPMQDRAGKLIGVLQLINARDQVSGEICAFSHTDQRFIEALTSQAAISLTNQQLAVQTESAESAAFAKSRFLAAASHDLRQPMHALNLYLGALAGYALPAPARPVLANARHCAETIDEMFRSLLDISRIDVNLVKAEICVFPVVVLLDQIRREFAPQANAKGLHLRVAPCSMFVRSDPALLNRILRNLVSNAVRYTTHGKILVGCRRSADGVRLAVDDTGIGIAQDQHHAVFGEFYQIGNRQRNRAHGLGLGLAIVQRLARLLGAPLTLVSVLGRGSLFAVDLPRAQAMALEHALPVTGVGHKLAGALILVVDDQAAILDATRTLLEQWGCVVGTATSGSAALERLSVCTRAPDALICDFRLSGNETGIDVIDMLRAEFNRDIPAMLLTGDTLPDQTQIDRVSGLTVLHKPLQEKALYVALLRLIQSTTIGV